MPNRLCSFLRLAFIFFLVVSVSLVWRSAIFFQIHPFRPINFDYIDAVITYVNGSDPVFNASLQAERKKGVKIYYAQTPNRFDDHNDLRILLRSLDRHGRLFRYIFLVVSGETQVPGWLNRSHPKIKIVYHSDIWEVKSQLPVFDSLAIESNLHHIPGLSEIFVYFNDDLVVTSDLRPTDFLLTDGKSHLSAIKYRPDLLIPIKYKPSENLSDSHWVGPATRTRNKMRELCAEKLKTTLAFDHMPLHAPHVLVRSVLYHAEKNPALNAWFNFTSASKFRNGYELNIAMLMNIYSQCVFNLQIYWGKSTDVGYLGVNRNNPEPKYLKVILSNIKRHKQTIKHRLLKYLCLNDVTEFNNITDIGTKAAEIIYGFRESLFPDKSEFELS